jgi:hypothetical protein
MTNPQSLQSSSRTVLPGKTHPESKSEDARWQRKEERTLAGRPRPPPLGQSSPFRATGPPDLAGKDRLWLPFPEPISRLRAARISASMTLCPARNCGNFSPENRFRNSRGRRPSGALLCGSCRKPPFFQTSVSVDGLFLRSHQPSTSSSRGPQHRLRPRARDTAPQKCPRRCPPIGVPFVPSLVLRMAELGTDVQLFGRADHRRLVGTCALSLETRPAAGYLIRSDLRVVTTSADSRTMPRAKHPSAQVRQC